MRLKIWGLGFLCLICGTGTFLVLHHITVTKADRSLYETLMRRTKELRSTDILERHPSEQARKLVEKDLWTQKGEERLHFHVASQSSNLLLSQKAKETNLRELMDHVVYTSEAPAMLLSAAYGFYEYPSLQMAAKEVACQHQLGRLSAGSAILEGMEGHLLTLHDHVTFIPSIEAANISISSEEAKCYWDTSIIEFTRHVHMDHAQEKLVASGDHAVYSQGILTLYPETVDEKCSVTRETDLLNAREIRFDLEGEKMFCLDTTGQLEKESFVIADLVVYDFRTQDLTLTANAPRHVLFWRDGCSLSASEILITKEHKVKAKGDVHGTFTVEEKNLIEQLISKYL